MFRICAAGHVPTLSRLVWQSNCLSYLPTINHVGLSQRGVISPRSTTYPNTHTIQQDILRCVLSLQSKTTTMFTRNSPLLAAHWPFSFVAMFAIYYFQEWYTVVSHTGVEMRRLAPQPEPHGRAGVICYRHGMFLAPQVTRPAHCFIALKREHLVKPRSSTDTSTV